jgi:hypothetical protein
VNVSGKYVSQAKKIEELSPEMYQDILSGKLTLTHAAKQLKASDAPESQPESKRFTALEVIDKLVRMISDDLISDILTIAEETTKPVRKTIRSCFIFDAPSPEAETEVEAEAEAEDENADADDYTEADADVEGYTESIL